jgi:putative restriction endonuclease
MFKKAFSKHIHATNVDGSKKTASYIRAVDLLNEKLKVESFGFSDCENIWNVNSVDRLQELYLFVLMEGKNGDEGTWDIKGIPTSYLQNGYCSAALKNYQEFLVEHVYEQELPTIFNEHKGDESKVVEKLDREIHYPTSLLEGLEEKHGREVVRSVRVRSNQNVFRLIILKIYNESCCITGLNISEVNRASQGNKGKFPILR